MTELFTHGGEITVKYDHSVNLNPLGMPESAVKAYLEAADELSRYPDREQHELCRLISEKEGYPEGSVLCGAGAADLIYRTVFAVKPEKALIFSPAFTEYKKALLAYGCEVMYCGEDDYKEKLSAGTDIVFVCSPNNPTGMQFDSGMLTDLSERCRENGSVLVIDESFIFFCENRQPSRILYDNGAVLIRSLTKIYAMPALRIGYLLCRDAELVNRIRQCGQSWSVGTPAMKAAAAALEDDLFEKHTAEYVRTEREYLTSELEKLGFTVCPSEVNFVLLQTDIPLRQILLVHDISVRDCSDMCGGGYYRIAVSTHQDNKHLIETLRRCINETR